MRALALVPFIVATLAASAGAASATPLKFVLSGDDNYTWTLDSNPSPAGFTGSNTYFSGVAGLPANFLTFYVSGNLGGLSAGTDTSDASGTLLFDLAGPQIFTGQPDAPVFSTGVFQMTTDFLRGGPSNDTLTVSNIAATPIPAALPLFASALSLLGFAGWRRKRADA